MITGWLATAEQHSKSLHNGKRIFQAYGALLRYMEQEEWTGACHSSSVVLFTLLSELGFSPKLMVGEVEAPAGIFDHSWIVVDGLIFDAAAGFPGEEGHHVGGSVFASIDLLTGQPTQNEYGVRSANGLDEIGKFVAGVDLGTYVAGAPGLNLWDITRLIGASCGVKIKPADVRRRYGGVMRTYAVSDFSSPCAVDETLA